MARISLALVPALVAAVLVAGPPNPSRAAPVPRHLMPKEEPACFPTRVGDRSVSLRGEFKIVTVVSKVEKTPDGTVVWLESEDATGMRSHDQTARVSAKGVEVLEYAGKKLDPTFWWFKFPHGTDNTWSDRLGAETWTGKTVGWEDVEVPAGKFRAFRVQHIDSAPLVRTTDYWFAPGMGCIKWSDGTGGREMTEFIPGK